MKFQELKALENTVEKCTDLNELVSIARKIKNEKEKSEARWYEIEAELVRLSDEKKEIEKTKLYWIDMAISNKIVELVLEQSCD